ncbi:MAG: peptide ABC transporter permease [Anaerolineaceae bacterium]|nr:peptide ABC transporter permease [Anaerolineaceae bacterium]
MSRLNNRLKFGTFLLAIFLILGGILPFFSPYDVRSWNAVPRNLSPSAEHFLGTTNLGQDTFWLLTFAIQNSLIIGVVVAFFATAIGVLAGLTAGFIGGIVDRVLTLLMDVFIVVPSLPILILMASLLQGRASLLLISIILILFNWPWPARQARSIALSMREREFINTARFSGSSTLFIITREILPYILSWVMANFVNTVLVAIATESGLAVIGLSSLEQATLGTMIYWALQHQALLGQRWWWIGSPVVAIIVLFFGLFLISTGFSDMSAEKRGHQYA